MPKLYRLEARKYNQSLNHPFLVLRGHDGLFEIDKANKGVSLHKHLPAYYSQKWPMWPSHR